MNYYSLEVNKKNIEQNRIVEDQATACASQGEVVLNIERFGLTSNNITYAAMGKEYRYWDFFSLDEHWGRVPSWGIARVTESTCDDIHVGERFYGFFPMSTQFIASPGEIKSTGFVDSAPHRRPLPEVYNQYIKVMPETGFAEDLDNFNLIYRPLLLTSFLLGHRLKDDGFYQAKKLLVSSSSSKTAIAMAHILRQINDSTESDTVELIGLTSTGNMDFVKSTSLYDDVVDYNDIATSLDTAQQYAIVDFAGNAKLINQIEAVLHDKLKLCVTVGKTDWQANAEKLSDSIKRNLFFAPSEYLVRSEDWGGRVLNENLFIASNKFAQDIGKWIKTEECHGAEQLQATYLKLLSGGNPSKSYVIVNRP